MLSDLLLKGNIQVNIEAVDWEDAIKKSAMNLVESKKILSGYITSMIQSIHEFGPYIVIMPGIAFAHARPDETVLENTIGLSILTNPIEFGSKLNDPVKVIFTIAAKSNESHLESLQGLAMFLSEQENIDLLYQEDDIEVIFNKIVNY